MPLSFLTTGRFLVSLGSRGLPDSVLIGIMNVVESLDTIAVARHVTFLNHVVDSLLGPIYAVFLRKRMVEFNSMEGFHGSLSVGVTLEFANDVVLRGGRNRSSVGITFVVLLPNGKNALVFFVILVADGMYDVPFIILVPSPVGWT